MHQPSLPLQRTSPQRSWGGEAMEGVETLPAPRQQWGVYKETEQREEMDLTKRVLLAAKRETPCSHAFHFPADPLLGGIN